jgi:diguanylate cyclase (GGDEF)-like protein
MFMNPTSLATTGDVYDSKTALTQLAAAQEVLRVSEERYRTAFETSLDAIAICRMDDGMFVDVNRSFFDILGYQRAELVGQTSAETSIWVDSDGEAQSRVFLDVAGRSSEELNIWDNPADWERLMEILRKDSVCRAFEAKLRRKNGETIWGRVSASAIELEAVPCVLLAIRDITEAKAAEEKIESLSYYDPLTCLPNRSLLLERLDQSLTGRGERNRYHALMVFDLDQFNLVNDVLGHQVGDLLLQEYSRRIFSCIRETDILARLNGDEFAVLLANLSEVSEEEAATQAQFIAQRVLNSVAQPYILAGRECRCTASVGITLFDNRGSSAEEIIQQSDIAINQAKNAGRSCLRFFAPALQTAVNARVAMEEDLRLAIERDEFVLYYQPQLHNKRIIGAEALIRWRHPTRGLVFPDKFIPLAEETGLILGLGDWVLETACRQAAAWQRSKKMDGITISVNISARQIHQPAFVEKVLSTLRRTGVDPHRIQMELTEGSLVIDIESVIARMSHLRAHGLQFSVDDFGVGYSSLSYLKRLPLDKLKIDRSFVRDILQDQSSSAIAQAIISLCSAMNLSVIAEGVESEEQREHLAGLGCHTFQGYLFSKALPAREFERLLVDLPDGRSQIAG